MSDTTPKSLIEKIRQGITTSGFPLEMSIGNILKNNEWGCTIGSVYEDFETGILREIDICASKTINGIEVELLIECKKSE
ncbi:MAG: hypothetical protein H3C54_13255, partial [Taibaiella sp.]|nr:hypothetical protein [Taibaiella sp.]